MKKGKSDPARHKINQEKGSTCIATRPFRLQNTMGTPALMINESSTSAGKQKGRITGLP
jgi:hypothetical protein